MRGQPGLWQSSSTIRLPRSASTSRAVAPKLRSRPCPSKSPPVLAQYCQPSAVASCAAPTFPPLRPGGRLTPPSSGQPQAGFAHLRLPLMSNVRRRMRSSATPPTLLNAIAIAALAFVIACTSHEVLGHGAACLAEGGRIALLTSVYFHCEHAGVITDLAGPIANLLLGLAAFTLLERRDWSTNVRYLLALTFAFNFFWLAGCMLDSAASNESDFAYPLRVLSVNPPWVGRAALGSLGLLVYGFALQATSRYTARGASLAASYVAAGLVSCAAALLFVGTNASTVRGAALESFGSAIGLLVLAGAPSRRLSLGAPSVSSASGYGWLSASALATLAFVLLLGRGLVVTGNA